MPRYLLDTNLCICIKNHRPAEVLARSSKLPPGSVAMSVITYGERHVGVQKSARPNASQRTLAQLVELIPALEPDESVSNQYGKICQHLQASGKLIGNNDLWIAAHALAKKLILVTNNLAEFKRVPGLRVENWGNR